LLPLEISKEWQAEILAGFPERPLDRRERFMDDYGLPEYDADILTQERGLSDYFENAAKAYGADPKKVSNWLMNDVLRMINEQNLSPAIMKLTPEYLAELIKLVDAGTINLTTGKALLQQVQDSGKKPSMLVEEHGLAQVSDEDAIREVCLKVIDDNPSEVEAYRGGKESLLGWFVGQVMRETKGKADAKSASSILKELL
jgi:aspartyl-tRNA(Asn)/glutamyl-tRNA(Gln) amidotransferase subunit B